jgi:hypothetical protein
MELGQGAWPFPAEWGKPANVPREALFDSAAASRFLATWPAGIIRQQRARRLAVACREALQQLETRIRNQNRMRLVEILAKSACPTSFR